MCTIGAVSNVNREGKRLSFLMKTIDAPPLEVVNGFLYSGNVEAVVTLLMKQPGINIGMNQRGLAVTLSYSDYIEYRGEAEGSPRIEDDTRALANAEILKSCSSVEEGIAFLKDFVPLHPCQFGGNHLLIDRNGAIALLEQCRGRYEYKSFTTRGYCERGNNSHWLIREEQSSLVAPLDSLPREKAMESFLITVYKGIPKGMECDEIIEEAKSLLSQHSERTDQRGGICVHGLNEPGARIFGDATCHTLSAVILDLSKRTMHYSIGSPCQRDWHNLTLGK